MLLNYGVGQDFESPLNCKEIQSVNPKGNQSWMFTGRTDIEAEIPILRPPDAKNWLIWKDPDAGKDWMWEEKGKTEDEIVGWHHWLNGYEFEQVPRVGDNQGGLACCSPSGHKESNTTEQLIWTELIRNEICHLLQQDGPCGYHHKWNKSEKGKYCMVSYMQTVKKKKQKKQPTNKSW